MSGGNFHITNFGGNVLYPYNAPQTLMPHSTAYAGTYMTGSGNIDSVGGGVSGTYQVGGAFGVPPAGLQTGWDVDKGTFSGARIQ